MATSQPNSENLDYQRDLIEILRPMFEDHLLPSEIMVNMSIDRGLKERIRAIEEPERRKAVVLLLDAVLDDPKKHMSTFIFALRHAGFNRFIDILDDAPGNKDEEKREAKFGMLITLMQGDLKDLIIPSEIIDHLKLVTNMSQGEYERIKTREDQKSPQDAFDYMMTVIQRKTEKWPLYLLEAVYQALGEATLAKITSDFRQNAGVPSAYADDDDGDDMVDVEEDDYEESMTDVKRPVDNDQTLRKDVAYQPMDEEVDMTSMSSTVAPMSRSQRLQSLETGVSSMNLTRNGDQSLTRELVGQSLSSMTGVNGSARSMRSARSPASNNGDVIYSREEGPKDDRGIPDMKLREYQKELAEHALEGKNTIICAPTGSGKTRVSLYIILKHLGNAPQGKKAKVVFLARTVPLVTQQFQDCLRYFSSTYKVTKLTGEDEGSMYMYQLLDRFDIIVMTPQILLNQLKAGLIQSMSVFTMIILDECHHTRKGEPYNNIMLTYLKEKQNIEKRRQRGTNTHQLPQLPQIVGLTASLGVEKAATDADAVNNIYKLMANMDSYHLSTVETHLAELRQTVPVPEEKTLPLAENLDDPARKVIEETMLKIEKMMIQFGALHDKSVDSLLMKRPRDRSSQPYSQWATTLKAASRDVETGHSDGVYGVDVNEERAEMARSLFVMADQLFRYNAALEIHQIVRIKDVILYLSKELGHPCLTRNGRNVHVESENQLNKLFTDTKIQLMDYEQQRGEDPSMTNPNLISLSRTLSEQLATRGQDSRIIIFVRTRATCEALVSWFNEDEHLPERLKQLKANIFTGAGAKEQEGGMTQVEQEEVLSRFRAGTVKVLVATSVAEEGLDIPECNITLRYNHVGNEVTTIQTRGRTRKAGGISVLLGNNQIRRREMLNVTRADMMSRAVSEIRSKPVDRNLRTILHHQKEILEEEEIKELVARQKKFQKVKASFTLQCANCRTFAVSGKDMRLLGESQHVVVDKKFLERVNVVRFMKSKVDYDDIKITGALQCIKCHKPWGVSFIHKGISFSSVKIDYFNVMNQDTMEQSHYKSWKKFPFQIEDMSHRDFKRHLAVDSEDSDSDSDF